MTFEPRKFNDIFELMRQRALASGVLTDLEVGSVTRTLAESFSYEIAQLYEQMQLVYLSAYIDTATGQQLDNVVSILGVTRGEPDFAEGVVTFQRDVGNEDINIPFGTLVATEDTPDAPKKVYQTIAVTTLPKDQPSVNVRVQAINRGEAEVVPALGIVVMPRPIPGIKTVVNAEATTFTGKRRETDEELRERGKNTLISSGKASRIAIENALLSMPGVKDARVLEKGDEEPPQFGSIDVYVDGVDFSDQAEVKRVRDELDRVRAAGIFALLKATVALEIESVFRIEIDATLKLSAEQRAAFEDNVRAQIESYGESLKMGDSLLLSQITKSILSVNGVKDLARFTMVINRHEDATITSVPFNPDTDRRLESAPSERFKMTVICVASEDKPLPIDLQYQASAGLTVASSGAALTALNDYFGGLALGEAVDLAQVGSRISGAGITLKPNTLHATPQPWCGSVAVNGTTIPVRFVEKATLGKLFAYQSVLRIIGAFKLTLPPSITDAARQLAESLVRLKLSLYIESLNADADLVFGDMVTLAQSVSPVQAVEFEPSDFQVRLDNGAPLSGRVSSSKIDVQAFEKAVFEFLLATDSVRVVDVMISALSITATVSGVTPTGNALATAQNTIKTALSGKPLLPNIAAGQNVSYDAVRSAIEALIPGTTLTVTALTLNATSQGDGRTQTISAVGTSIHVRSVEIASIHALSAAAITVNVVGTQPPPQPVNP